MIQNNISRPDFGKSFDAVQEYFKVVNFDDINDIFVDLFTFKKTLKQRIHSYQKYKSKIDELQKVFKKIVIERNKAVQKLGYRDYFDFRTKADGVSIENLNYFERNIEKIVKTIFNSFPKKVLSEIKWTEYNIPYPDASFNYVKAKTTHKKIIGSMAKLYPILQRNLKRVIINISDKHLYSSCLYFKKGGNITINTKRLVGINESLVFVHELGHAIDYLECEEKGVDHFKLTHYRIEERAIQVEREFAKKFLPIKLRHHLETNILKLISQALFEKEIYTNTKEDFSLLFATAVNQCYPPSHQRKNPFYVLNDKLILKPLNSLPSSIIYSKLILNKIN